MSGEAIQPAPKRTPRKLKRKPPRFAPDPNTPVEPDDEHCNGRCHTEDHHLCDNWPGMGTNHLGVGRCKLHAGSSNVKTGIHSKIKFRELRELIEEFLAEPDRMKMLDEAVATLIALFVDWVNRYNENRAALLAWYESQLRGGEAERPRQVLDISDGHHLLVEATKVIKRIEDIRAANAMSIGDLERLMRAMAAVVERWLLEPGLTPEQRIAKIRDGWLAFHF